MQSATEDSEQSGRRGNPGRPSVLRPLIRREVAKDDEEDRALGACLRRSHPCLTSRRERSARAAVRTRGGIVRAPRRVRGGRASVRSALYLGAMNASRFNPGLRRIYERLRQAGKPPKLAFLAIARKLLTMLNAIARDRVGWQDQKA